MTFIALNTIVGTTRQAITKSRAALAVCSLALLTACGAHYSEYPKAASITIVMKGQAPVSVTIPVAESNISDVVSSRYINDINDFVRRTGRVIPTPTACLRLSRLLTPVR